MKIEQSFVVSRPRTDVWALFQNVPEIAQCMPGATLTEQNEDGRYAGRLAVKLGPFTATFEGEATHAPDPDTFTGHVDGKGIDKRGGSRTRLAMDYALDEAGDSTEVRVDANVQLSGPIAQFGRIGVIEETARLLIEQFVSNIERRLSAPAMPEATQAVEAAAAVEREASPAPDNHATAPSLNGLALLRMLIARYFKRLFGARG